MPRSSTKALTFPLAGVSRRGSYRQQTRPYSAPWALNVRTDGPTESRQRGGSRPGLSKFSATDLGSPATSLIPITYLDASGARQHDLVYVLEDGTMGFMRAGANNSLTAELEGPDGVDILTDDDDTIVFDAVVSSGLSAGADLAGIQGAVRAGKLYLADATLKRYDPSSGVVEPVTATAGTVPTGQPLIANYRDRIVLAGSSQAVYCSRLGAPTDWDYGAALEDTGGAIVLQTGFSGRMGFTLTALIPVDDEHLVLASSNELWVLYGDPVTGRLRNVSEEIGVVAPGAWAMSPDGLLAFLSNDGVYVWQAGSGQHPTRFSEERVPDELREVDTTSNTVSMAYDPNERGFHLFVTPSSGNGTHWWIDFDNKALWPQLLVATQQPLSVALMSEAGLGNVVLGSKDNYLRYFVDGVVTDDGQTLTSHVLIGPVRIAADDVRDALLAEIHGVMDELGGTVTWRVVMGRSASEAAEAAKADLDAVVGGGDPSNVSASGTWTEGRGYVSRPRSRGAWLVIWLSSDNKWSFEVVAIVARQLGRHR